MPEIDPFLILVAALSLTPLLMVCWNLTLFGFCEKDLNDGEELEGVPTRGAVSVLIPARNEVERLPGLLGDLAAQTDVEFEVVVFDDQSTDGTGELVDRWSENDPRFRRVTGEGPESGWNGKQFACQRLADEARYDEFLFLDADLRLQSDAVARIACTSWRWGIPLISGFPRLITVGLLERLLLPQIHFVLLGYLPMFWMRRSIKPSFGAGCGQCFFTDRDSYQRAGGHAVIRSSRHDGVQLPRAYRRAGLRTDVFDASDCMSVRMYESGAEVWRGLSKNAEEGLGGKVSIWVWTVLLGAGAWLPILLLLMGVGEGSTAARSLLWACALAAPLGRVLLAWRLRQDPLSALLHPLGVLLLLSLQWHARIQRARGRTVSWKERPV